MSVGAFAGIMMTMADVNMAVARSSRYKAPHMLYDQLKWIKQNPPKQPTVSLSVTLSVDGYRKNNFKPLPATGRRDTDMCSLADTGCQACCMGVTQLHTLGLTRNDLLAPVLNLRAANTSGINIHLQGLDVHRHRVGVSGAGHFWKKMKLGEAHTHKYIYRGDGAKPPWGGRPPTRAGPKDQ